jgi:hypothetical protein
MKKSINKTDISTLLDQWYDAKNSIAELEDKIEKYKKLASKVMNNNNTNIITDGTYTIKRKEIERFTISKKDVPNNIWKEYSKKNNYNAFYLTKI